jgi:hypothetical protein
MERIMDCGKPYTTGEALNESPRIMFGEKVHFSKIPDTPENHILRSNIQNNGYRKTGIKCITGNWQPLLKDDIVLKDYEALKKLTVTI